MTRLLAISIALLALASARPSPLSFAEDSSLAFHGGTTIHFAGLEKASELLRRSDRYTQAQSPFDRQARLRSDAPVSERELLKFAAQQVSDWPPEDIERVGGALARLLPKMAALAPIFPPDIYLVQTTGQEEGGAAYCRGPAIILPHRHVRRDDGDMERLLAHELFHVASSHDADLRARLYAIVGFELCPPIEVPPPLASRKLTNPDGPLLDNTIELVHGGRKARYAPLLYSSAEKYDPAKIATIFDVLTFRLLEVAPDKRRPDRFVAVLRDGEPSLLDPKEAADFQRQIGRNTNYIIHPDEILADNFAHLVLETPKLPSPEIVERMKRVLAR